MTILGIFLSAVSMFIISKSLVYKYFRKCVKGIIIEYGNPIKNYRGIESYPYKVKYKYERKYNYFFWKFSKQK